MKHKLHAYLISGLTLMTLNTAQAKEEVVLVDIPEKYGRSAAEYFVSPVVGLIYTDISGISNNFLQSDTQVIQYNNNINVNHNELGGVFGILLDAQYQVVSTDYWRIGFQTGGIYTSPAESEFQTFVCPRNNNNCNNAILENGNLEISSVQIPLLFTISRYAANDRFITSFKLGPSLVYQMYDTDFSDFSTEPDNEMQIPISIGLDGRLRFGDSDTFLLMGFIADVTGNNNNSFSGVDTVNSLMAYVGLSFS